MSDRGGIVVLCRLTSLTEAFVGEDRIFAAVFFLLGLCVTVFLGRVTGLLVGGTMTVMAYLLLKPGNTRIAVLSALCLAGIAITVHSGVTPALLVHDIAQLLNPQGRLMLFAGFGPDSAMRLGFGLFGSGLCGLVLAVLSALDGDDPS